MKYAVYCVDILGNRVMINIFFPEAKVRKQWKYLRDQFSVELGKHPPIRSGDPAEDMLTSKWPYFTQLLFLKDIVKPRTATGNLPRTSTQVTYQEESQDSSEHNDNSGNEEASERSQQESVVESSITSPSLPSPTTPIVTPIITKKRRGITDTYQETMLDIERRKVEYLESKVKKNSFTKEEDEHFSFFKSLLPHVRKIPENKILSFRNRVQDLVHEFCYLNVTSKSSSSYGSSAPPSGSSGCQTPYQNEQSSCSSAPPFGYNNINPNQQSSFLSGQQATMFQGHHDDPTPWNPLNLLNNLTK